MTELLPPRHDDRRLSKSALRPISLSASNEVYDLCLIIKQGYKQATGYNGECRKTSCLTSGGVVFLTLPSVT